MGCWLDHGHVLACRLGSHPGQHGVLAIFGKNVDDAVDRLGYLVFYFAGGFPPAMMQTAMTLLFGCASDAKIPALGQAARSPPSWAPILCSIPTHASARWCCGWQYASRRGSSSAAGSSTVFRR